jgi:hypothetical protein
MVSVLTKQCSKCKKVKSLSSFHKDERNKDKKRSNCIDCDKQASKKWKENNKEHIAEYNTHYKREYTYGLSKEAYLSLLDKQDYKCAICNTDQSKLSRKLVVDHCHTSNKVRGLLCSHCNVGIGMLKESEDNLMAAIQYLKANLNG